MTDKKEEPKKEKTKKEKKAYAELVKNVAELVIAKKKRGCQLCGWKKSFFCLSRTFFYFLIFFLFGLF